ncbi:septum site-determining protein MinC [Pelistega sp. NLN82]|uniref:Probable septum site-determining protein MinC n=1 Tax=Pelistega ratti TaxID=2652177 RepID=A0A6L9Y8Q0_9BURK|nr:septum site-determining protein MinC [Pelistega ratti]NEN76104.1 septum site-determining protein MinC [Pelistega ratti]
MSKHILEIKSSHLFTLRLILKTTDFSAIVKTLQDRLQETGSLFDGESIVIDAYGIVQPLPWRKLADVLEQHHLKILGIYTNERLSPSVIEQGFNTIELGAPSEKESIVEVPKASEVQATSTPITTSTTANPSLIVDRQLRSGERIYAQGSDLIVIGNVGHGAEIIADGNIHVYGHLFGRAIAGAKGDDTARIFTTYLDPQLVAIAGIYRLFDGENPIAELKKPVMVSLHQESLTFQAIKF